MTENSLALILSENLTAGMAADTAAAGRRRCRTHNRAFGEPNSCRRARCRSALDIRSGDVGQGIVGFLDRLVSGVSKAGR
ncbi:hypothetical protein OG429_02190 [Streptomyces sp. NBC_00190]|uniref:hypothetical protein n=1 Tax=unclassified Streptomyces TaxID=2593676 RepID=UPI002E2C02C8|nr:hypothetical protein [Streptomyces sp. NBC_00190]WSZ38230.1 hypothetical protein OG239_05185 [Streptomyces sp. NBC_00868]